MSGYCTHPPLAATISTQPQHRCLRTVPPPPSLPLPTHLYTPTPTHHTTPHRPGPLTASPQIQSPGLAATLVRAGSPALSGLGLPHLLQLARHCD